MWMRKLFLVVLEFLLYMVTVSEAWATSHVCWHCTGCSATQCSRVGDPIPTRLLDYLAIYDQEVNRQMQVTSPVISCSIPNKMCDYPYNKYCCDGTTMTCGLGEGWSTCVAGSALINNIITPIYTKSQCDFDFPCTGNGGNDCCGGLDLYNGEGAGTCSSSYCTSSTSQIVACNYVGSSALVYKTPDFDATVMVNGVMPTQSNNEYCGNNNRGNGRCKASNLCCSPLGLCDITVESCATKSISWAWFGGSISQWVQTGGATDSSIPCGNGTIGNGRCPTAADGSDYGIQCCSDSGMCDSKYCNGADGNVYKCSCTHGTAGTGTRGCKTCASCNAGYYLSSSNGNSCSPIKLGDFSCPTGTFVISIDFWYDSGSKFITAINYFTCSDHSTVNVNKGQKTGTNRNTPDVGGYCGGGIWWVHQPFGTTNELTTELTVSSCDDVKYSSGGPMTGDAGTHNYSYNVGSGNLLTGMQAATCQNGGSNNVCFLNFKFTTVQPPGPTPSTVPTSVTPTATTTVSCSSGKFIAKINLSAGSYVNGITSITCSDNAIMQISSGLTGTPYTATSGDGTGSSLGYCSYKSALSSSFVTQLKFVECSGIVDGTYGTTSATLTTGRCPTGQKAIGISFTQGGGFLTSFAFVCGTTTRNVLCGSGKYITSITLWSSDVVYGISSITCSNGSSKEVNTGLIGGSANTASSTGGYCTYSTGLSGSFITQFTLGECTTSATDGPYGTNSATVTGHGCPGGKMAIGVKTSTGTALTSFSFACATVSTAAPTPSPTSKPTAVPSSAPTSKTPKPSTASPTPVPTPKTPKPSTGAPTTAPTKTTKPTVAPSAAPTTGICPCLSGESGCTTCISCVGPYQLFKGHCALWFGCSEGYFLTKITLSYGDWLNGISSITCSNGEIITLNAGTTEPYEVVASSSSGYCSYAADYNGECVSQLKPYECLGGIDGPYGAIITTTGQYAACFTGTKAVGLYISGVPGSCITYFEYGCGPIP